MKFKRMFVLVMDSVGIGAEPDAALFGDEGSNTWVHTASFCHGLKVPNLNSLGLRDLAEVEGTSFVPHAHSYIQTLREASNGKDTLTGHWEMMGMLTPNPLVTFTDTGFPKELIDELSKRIGRKLIGNYSESGTVILQKLGKQAMDEGSLIIYTSADSVLQLAGHVGVIPLEELYKACEIARDLTQKPQWRVGRVIARPYLGDDASNFYRTTDRRDYALSPAGRTTLNDLCDSGKNVIAIGKIHDIFNGSGCQESLHITSNHDGMEKTIEVAKNRDFEGLCFINLVEFDSSYGHRRDPLGYGRCIEEFDQDLGKLLPLLHDDDLLMITADHGNDPTWTGSDHTRERVPLFSYSPSYKNGRLIDERSTFADIGKTILKNFAIDPSKEQIGTAIDELLED
ncbi:MAG: phosphopentomutase [Bacilli bacterium]